MLHKEEIIQSAIRALELNISEKRPDPSLDIISDALEHIKFFNQNIQLNQQQRRLVLKEISQTLQLERYLPDYTVFKMGEKGDKFFIVLQGCVELYKMHDISKFDDPLILEMFKNYSIDKIFSDRNGIQNKLEQCKKKLFERGQQQVKYQNYTSEEFFQTTHQLLYTAQQLDYFGELALSLNKPRLATAITKKTEDDQKWVILASMRFKYQQKQMQIKCQALQQFLPDKPIHQLISMTYCMDTAVYPQGHFIYKENQPADIFYIISEGEVRLERRFDKSQDHLNDEQMLIRRQKLPSTKVPLLNNVVILSQGSLFGFEEILSQEKRKCSAVCITQKVVLYAISEKKLQQMMGDHFEQFQVSDLNHAKQWSIYNKSSKQALTKIKSLKIFVEKNKIDLRTLQEVDNLQSGPKPKRNRNLSLGTSKNCEIPYINKPIEIAQGSIISDGFIPIPSQLNKVFSPDKIKQIVKRNISLQRSNSRMGFKINFTNPFFKEFEAQNLKQIRKMRLELMKQMNPQEFFAQYEVHKIFKNEPGKILSEFGDISMTKKLFSESDIKTLISSGQRYVYPCGNEDLFTNDLTKTQSSEALIQSRVNLCSQQSEFRKKQMENNRNQKFQYNRKSQEGSQSMKQITYNKFVN